MRQIPVHSGASLHDDGIAVSDSICYPKEASSKYPYNKDGSREFLESVPFVEALISVAAMGAPR